MANAINLPVAAALSFSFLEPWWVDSTLPTKSLAFARTVIALFPESAPAGHPVANWALLIEGLSAVMLGPAVLFVGLSQPANYRQMVDYVYRICWITQQLATQVPAQISGAQQAAVLAAYNANF